MERGFRSALALLTKRLLYDHRSPCCWQVHRGTAAAVPDKGAAMPYGRTAVERIQTLMASNALSDKPQVITPPSRKKVWWVCDQCPDGHQHSWSASVHKRSNGTGCPQCSGRKVCKHNTLATKAPLVAAQWDYEANHDATPDTVVAHSHQKVGWRCDACGHKWTSSLNCRVSRSTGCPQCSKWKKGTKRPTFAEHPLLAEWDHERNSTHGNYPDSITLGSNKRIFWLCNKCPAGKQHSWSAPPCNRTGRFKCGCPFCAGHAACSCNSLHALCPDIAAEWDYSRNQGHPSDYSARSHHVAWWSTSERGSWQQRIGIRTDPRWLGGRRNSARQN